MRPDSPSPGRSEPRSVRRRTLPQATLPRSSLRCTGFGCPGDPERPGRPGACCPKERREIPEAPHRKSRPAGRSRARRPRPKSEPMPVISVFSCSSLHTQSSSQNPAPFPCRVAAAAQFLQENRGSLPYGMPASSAIHAVLHFEIILSQKSLCVKDFVTCYKNKSIRSCSIGLRQEPF